MITEHDAQTGETITRKLTAAELAQSKKNEEILNAELKEINDKAAVRQAIFDRLGLTAEEAAILLG